MENRTVFLVAAVGLAGFTFANLIFVRPDVVQSLKNNTERVDYFQKGQNSSAKKINRTALHSYFQPIYNKQNWTASETKADKVRIFTAQLKQNSKNRKEASLKITKHNVRAGTGKVGKANRLYEYYG